MLTLLLAAAAAVAAQPAPPTRPPAAPSEMRVLVRGAKWILSVGATDAKCNPLENAPEAGSYECWNGLGDRALANRDTGCTETSGAGYCGPAEERATYPSGAFALVCDAGEVHMITTGSGHGSCWTRSDGGVLVGACVDGASLASANNWAVARCDSGCDESGGAGICAIAEHPVEKRGAR